MRALLSLIMAASLAISAPALAADKDQLKAEYKQAKAAYKDLDKAAGWYMKGVDKQKDSLIEKGDEALTEWYKAELKYLREMGIPSKKAEPYTVEGHPGKPIMPEPQRPKMEARRDMLVDLREMTKEGVSKGKKAKAKTALLGKLMDLYETRYENRKDKFKNA